MIYLDADFCINIKAYTTPTRMIVIDIFDYLLSKMYKLKKTYKTHNNEKSEITIMHRAFYNSIGCMQQ